MYNRPVQMRRSPNAIDKRRVREQKMPVPRSVMEETRRGASNKKNLPAALALGALALAACTGPKVVIKRDGGKIKAPLIVALDEEKNTGTTKEILLKRIQEEGSPVGAVIILNKGSDTEAILVKMSEEGGSHVNYASITDIKELKIEDGTASILRESGEVVSGTAIYVDDRDEVEIMGADVIHVQSEAKEVQVDGVGPKDFGTSLAGVTLIGTLALLGTLFGLHALMKATGMTKGGKYGPITNNQDKKEKDGAQ